MKRMGVALLWAGVAVCGAAQGPSQRPAPTPADSQTSLPQPTPPTPTPTPTLRFADVRAAYRPSDLSVLDRRGEPIQTLRVDPIERRLPWLRLADMSPALLTAIVFSEDRRFWEHSGVDWSALARRAFANLWNTRTRGASTLTMQLAGLLDADLARPAGGRSVAQKLGQAWVATQLEATWTKSEILEAYLNRVPFRGELVGINALSQTLFDKHPSGLDAQEAAIAAVLVRAPNAAPPRVAQRACAVLQAQGRACAGVTALAEMALARRGGMPLGEQLAPHLARQLEPGSGTLSSTLDAHLQRFAIQTLRRQLEELRGRNVEDGAVLVLDNQSGEVLAWVGSSGGLSAAAQVDGVLARRQAGSTLKPFVYGLAFEQKLLTPASLLDDSPLQLKTGSGLYLPQNYDRRHHGWVSARSALGSSLNVPAVRVGAMLGADAVHARLNALGLGLRESGGFYGDSLALGSAEVSLLGLTNAYRALANGGRYSDVVLQPAVSAPASRSGALASISHGGAPAPAPTLPGARRAPAPVADPAAAFLVTDILADNNARARTFGLDSPLATRGFAAVKTGTSKDMRDSWCVGFTERYSIGVWVGNASGAPMHEINGLAGAAPIWQALVRQLHAGAVSRRPLPPPGVLQAALRFDGVPEATRTEWFLAGTQPHGVQRLEQRRFGIDEPRDGSIFAIDPDMPPQAQRIRFAGATGTWRLDGKRVGSGREVAWSPWPGRHELALIDPQGRVLQTVRFEVRGAAVKTVASTR